MANKKAKKAKKVNNTVDFNDSYKKIKNTAKTVNKEVIETAFFVADELKENGEQLQEVATKKVKETMNVVAETVTIENIKQTTKNVNAYTLKTAEELVEVALENGGKWQAVGNKAVKGGLKLAAKQQDIVFDTLETVKGQLMANAGRFAKLFSKN